MNISQTTASLTLPILYHNPSVNSSGNCFVIYKKLERRLMSYHSLKVGNLFVHAVLESFIVPINLLSAIRRDGDYK